MAEKGGPSDMNRLNAGVQRCSINGGKTAKARQAEKYWAIKKQNSKKRQAGQQTEKRVVQRSSIVEPRRDDEPTDAMLLTKEEQSELLTVASNWHYETRRHRHATDGGQSNRLIAVDPVKEKKKAFNVVYNRLIARDFDDVYLDAIIGRRIKEINEELERAPTDPDNADEFVEPSVVHVTNAVTDGQGEEEERMSISMSQHSSSRMSIGNYSKTSSSARHQQTEAENEKLRRRVNDLEEKVDKIDILRRVPYTIRPLDTTGPPPNVTITFTLPPGSRELGRANIKLVTADGEHVTTITNVDLALAAE